MSGPGFWSVVAIFFSLALLDGLYFGEKRSEQQNLIMVVFWGLVGFTVGLSWNVF